MAEKANSATAEAERHARRLHELTAQQQKLVQLYYRDAISVEVMQDEQARIREEQAQVERWHSQAVAQVDDVMSALEDALVLLSKPGEAYEYAASDPTLRKILNRAIFERILIQVVDRQVEVEGVPHEIYNRMLQTAQALGLNPQAAPDATARASRPIALRRIPTTSEPQFQNWTLGFARRPNGGGTGIRTQIHGFGDRANSH